MAVFAEAGAVVESVSIHLEKCESCRAWEAEIRKMHRGCRESGAPGDVSRLTSSALQSRAAESPSPARSRREPRPEAERSSDRGALFVVALAVVLFNLILAFRLEGGARVLYPVIGFAVMIASAVWVYVDSTRRKMPAAFWTALQPFTVPAGLIAYLVCRERASLRCPSCGRTVPARDRFCPECGRGLAAFCCGCGRSVRKEFRVCPFCGTRLEECFPREDEAGRTCGWSRAQIVFLAGANVVLLAGFLAALLRGGRGDVFRRRVPLSVRILSRLQLGVGRFEAESHVDDSLGHPRSRHALRGARHLSRLQKGRARRVSRMRLLSARRASTSARAAAPCSARAARPAARLPAADRFCASCGAEMLSAAASPRSPE